MIVFDGAGKAYRGRKGNISWVFRDVSATFAAGTNVGILAPSGQGKTTLINIAAGNEATSEGRIYRQGKISWPWGTRSILSQRLSGRQNLRFLTDIYGRDFKEAYEFVRQFADIGRYLDAPMRQYTSEMRARLGISALFSMGFDFILVDDGMEGGDLNFRKKCIRYIDDNKHRLTFLIATEKPQLLARYCQSAGVLNEGQLTFYGSVEEATEQFNRVNQVLA